MTHPAAPAMVRIVCGQRFGTGVLISPRDILTAAHVVEHGKITDIQVTGQAFSGTRKAVDISYDNRQDIAILHLDPVGAAHGSAYRPLPETEVVLANVGDKVTALGFANLDRDLEERALEYSAFDGVANMFVLNPAVPEGFSGGVLMRNDDVAALTIARNTGSLSSYAYPIAQALDFIRTRAKGTVVYATVQVSELLRYPLGPMVPLQETLSACGTLVRVLRQYGPDEARQAIADANQARTEAGPPPTAASHIDLSGLPRPEFNPTGFWHGALGEAGKKSPRMLAALLLVIEDNNLTTVQRQERTHFLRRLESWATQHC